MTEKTTIVFLTATIGCIGFLFFRIIASGSPYYDFMIWNLFLAWIPVILSNTLFFLSKKKKKHYLVPLFLLWLLFIPNAPYMITDFIHLTPRSGIPLWVDGLLLLSFATLGLGLGLASFMTVEQVMKKQLGKKIAQRLEILLLLLISVGIMLGRMLRWNSWDVILNPGQLWVQLQIFLHSTAFILRLSTWSMFFFFFLFFLHMILKRVIQPEA